MKTKEIICPRCKQNIPYFDIRTRTESIGFMDNSGDIDWENNTHENIISEEISCPECEKVIFSDQEDAVAFLRGGE